MTAPLRPTRLLGRRAAPPLLRALRRAAPPLLRALRRRAAPPLLWLLLLRPLSRATPPLLWLLLLRPLSRTAPPLLRALRGPMPALLGLLRRLLRRRVLRAAPTLPVAVFVVVSLGGSGRADDHQERDQRSLESVHA
jgi:hypothetical protein